MRNLSSGFPTSFNDLVLELQRIAIEPRGLEFWILEVAETYHECRLQISYTIAPIAADWCIWKMQVSPIMS